MIHKKDEPRFLFGTVFEKLIPIFQDNDNNMETILSGICCVIHEQILIKSKDYENYLFQLHKFNNIFLKCYSSKEDYIDAHQEMRDRNKNIT